MCDDNKNIEINCELEDLDTRLGFLKLQKDELITQIKGEKKLLNETEQSLKDIDSKIVDIKIKIGEGQGEFISEQEKNLRNEVLTLSTIPALAIGGLIITFGGLSASLAALASSVGSYFVVSSGVYNKKAKNVRLNSVDEYRLSKECISLTEELDELKKQRQILNDRIYDIKYEINCYNNQLNILTSKIIFVESSRKELLNGSYKTVNTDALDVSVVRALR